MYLVSFFCSYLNKHSSLHHTCLKIHKMVQCSVWGIYRQGLQINSVQYGEFIDKDFKSILKICSPGFKHVCELWEVIAKICFTMW